MKVSARLAVALLVGCLTTCRSGSPPAAGEAAVALPALLHRAPADAVLVAYATDLPALLGGVSQYAKTLLTGTAWEPSASKRAEWRDLWGFDPLQAESYADVGVDVAAGAMVMVLDPNQLLRVMQLGVKDPNLLDAALERIGTVKGQAPQRQTRTVAGRSVVSWVAANAEGSALHRVYVDQFVLLARDLAPLEALLNRPVGAPCLAEEPNVLRGAQHVVAGNLWVWSRHQGQTGTWGVTSVNMGATGIAAEGFTPARDELTAGPLPELLNRLDPGALVAYAVALENVKSGDTPGVGWGDANQVKAWDDDLAKSTGVRLLLEVASQFAGQATAEVLWEADAAVPPSPLGALAKLQGALTVQVRDTAAVAALLERCRAHMAAHKELGYTLEADAPVRVNDETVAVYRLKSTATRVAAPAPGPVPPAGAKRDARRGWMQPAQPSPRGFVPQGAALSDMQPARVAVWHGRLILVWGEQALTHALGLAQGRDNHWLALNQGSLLAKHVQGRSSLMVLRFAKIADLLGGQGKLAATLPALRDTITLLRRLGDVVSSSRYTADGAVHEWEQRFPVDTAQTL